MRCSDCAGLLSIPDVKHHDTLAAWFERLLSERRQLLLNLAETQSIGRDIHDELRITKMALRELAIDQCGKKEGLANVALYMARAEKEFRK